MTSDLLPVDSTPRIRRRRWPWVVLAGVILAPIITTAILRAALAGKVEAQLAAIRARGEPLVLEDFIKNLPPVTAGQRRAMELYRDAFEGFVTTEQDLERLPIKGKVELEDNQGLSPENLAAVRDYLKRNEQALQKLHQALELGPPYLGHDAQGFTKPAGLYDQMIACREFLALEAFFKAETGDVDGAIATIRAGRLLETHLRQPPYGWIDHLVAIAIKSMVLDGSIQRLLNRAALTDAQLLALLEQCKPEADDPIGVALLTERADELKMFEMPFSNAAARGLYRLSGFYDCDKLQFLGYHARVIQAARLPLPQRLDLVRSIRLQTTGLAALYTRISAQATAEMGRAYVLDARVQADLATARAALAVERFRLANGRLPDSLGELAPRYLEAVPPDPFTGQPLVYKKLSPTAFTVYSLGEDKTDNGGAKKNAQGQQYDPGADIPFTVNRLESQ